MPLAAPPALLLPLLGLAAAAVADCPSSTWIQFQDNCYIFLQEAIKVESIEDVRNQCTDHGADMISIHNEEENAFILDTLKKQWKGSDDILLGMFYDTDDASFKWFDNSNMTFDKWTDQDDGEDLIDTCAFLHIKTGEWKKGNCEVSFVEGTLCKTAIPYKRKYLSGFYPFSECGVRSLTRCSLDLLGSSNSSTSASQVPWTTGVGRHTQIIFFVQMGFHPVTQASLKLLGSNDPPTSASQSAEITGVGPPFPATHIIFIELPLLLVEILKITFVSLNLDMGRAK
ncbi:CD302 antigen isoform X1 [Macaca thibetana thibetana]|uniref:CD302 antigen isoform X1 n=1 Tax=Macaca thibetana thibetana TaxID=257877 RepID=UPI0021BCC351|nr:CD302 antigen isoform X1 [Macaca thibetana thibetana]